ncbi:uncharacterized protein LOC103190156 isoform X2 [Callorhinchus milii]|uniref:uncharacterized protein LOC103190156 isoform X2 n=1 Tax=Callorhinchus milii TaxID=7868 RepID=UPI00045745D1|nr:uncharacterized protein LOC103190156 isoform X2 [Callorhinchus milii]|eukprot:gi/632984228/ref/XP_007909036.1/ PREDICTED: uncharacterized protein LOC103190156 isoform X2 [Callorhinchus milii]
MECPLCGNVYPKSKIECHAWHCYSRTTPGEEDQPSEGAGEGGSREQDGQRAAKGETLRAGGMEQDCPLCGLRFPAADIEEHAAFCNGPSYSRSPEEEEVAGRAEAQRTGHLFWSYVNRDRRLGRRGAECARREPGGSVSVWGPVGASGGCEQDISQELAVFQKFGQDLEQNPEFIKAVKSLLSKSKSPLEMLKNVSMALFSAGVGGGGTVFMFFQLAKMFLPMILESESFVTFQKWAGSFILTTVVPWIERIGGWPVVLAMMGAVLAVGLFAGFIKLLQGHSSQ